MAFAILNRGDAVGVGLFNEKVRGMLRPERGISQYRRILRELSNPANYDGECNFEEAVRACVHMLRPETLLILITDAVRLQGDWELILKVANRKFEVVALLVRDPRDDELPASGHVMVEDPYSGEQLLLDTDGIRGQYASAAREIKEHNLAIMRRGRIADVPIIMTTDDFPKHVISFFERRKRRMREMMEFTFASPVFLWFLLLIPLLTAVHFYSLHFARQKAMRFANFEALEKILQTKQVVPNNYLVLAMRLATLVGFTLAASGITMHYQATTAAYDYVIALDTSSSMLAQDLSPTRMGAAQSAISGFANSVPFGAKVGLVQFSSQAKAVLAPTQEAVLVGWAARGIVPERSGGTAICEAIKAAANQFNPEDSPRAVVVVSDGQNNAGCLLSEGIDYAKSHNVTVFAIGAGSLAGGEAADLPGVKFTFEETDLRSVAEGTGGRYYRAENADQLSSAFSELGKNVMRSVALPLSVPIMMFAFLLVFIDWGLSVTRYRTIP
jgi:Ca-activated chloride channel homolog